MVKTLLTLFILCFSSYQVFGIVAAPSVATYDYTCTDEFVDQEGVVWVGNFLQSVVDSANFIQAIQYEVVDVWQGEISTVQDPMTPEYLLPYQNTSTTVWVINGWGISSQYDFGTMDYLFVSTWYGQAYYHGHFPGYLFFPIDQSNNSVTGAFNNIGGPFETLPLATVQNQLQNHDCSTSGISQLEMSHITAFPNPTTGIFNIAAENKSIEFDQFTIYSITGNEFQHTKNDISVSIDITMLPIGRYFFQLKERGLIVGAGQIIKE